MGINTRYVTAAAFLFVAFSGNETFALESVREEGEKAALSSNREVLVPAELIREIENWYLKDFRKRKKDDTSTDVQVLSNVPRRLLNLVLEITPKSGNAVSQAQQLRLPTGGGVVDLARSVEGGQGAFLMQMKLDNFVEGSDLRVFYVSGSRKATVMNESYGAGCRSWMEVSTWYENTHSKVPIEVFAAEQRYVRVLGGTWVFSAINDGTLQLAAVTLKDSRFPQIACD